MAHHYYYLISSLPNLIFESEAKSFDFLQLKDFIYNSVSSTDRYLIDLLFSPIDIQNILNVKFNEHLPFINGGKYNNEDILEGVKQVSNLPTYVLGFLNSLEKPEDENYKDQDFDEDNLIVAPEQLLYQKFYTYIDKKGNQFIKKWFTFDREMRNIQAAFIARKENIQLNEYLIGNDDITELLLKTNTSDFGLRRERDYIDKLFQALEFDDILEREKKLDLLRWWYIDDITTFNYFDINVVLAFLQKAAIIDRWIQLDTKSGSLMFEELVNELKETYDIDKVFKSLN